jgi:ribose 1,5-bisphosphate isomerase
MASVRALTCRFSKSKARSCKILLCELDNSKRELFATRPTEPLMRNALDYIEKSLSGEKDTRILKKKLDKVCAETLLRFEATREKIAVLGAKKIENGMVVFTHCHSSTVMRILKKAKAQGKRFEVYNTEARPLMQGRITAKELATAGIKVTHFVDSAANVALGKADVAFLGFDAITSDGVYNKIGSGLFALAAKKQGVPLYACGDSWKFDADNLRGRGEGIEARSPKEVWPAAPRGVKIENPCFELIDRELIAGIISELGVHSHKDFIARVRKAYPWLK